MATYELTSPQGEKYHVDAPDDASEDQVMSYFHQNVGKIPLSSPVSETHPQNLFERLKQVGIEHAAKAGEIAGNGQINGASRAFQQAGNVAGGIGDTLGQTVASIANLAPDIIKKPIGDIANQAFQAVSDSPVGSFLANESGKQQAFAERNPELSSNLEAASNIAGLVPIDQAVSLGNKIAAPVAKGAGAVLEKGAQIAGDVTGGILPKVNEGLVDVADMAKKYKIPLSLDQISDSRALKNVQKVSQELPFSGQSAFRDMQMLSFNRALLKTIGQDGTRFTPQVIDKAFNEVGKEFDNLGAGKTFKLDDNFARSLDAIRQDAKSTVNQDAIHNFENEAANVLKAAGPLGEISGEKLGQLRARVNSLARKTNNFDTKGLLHDLENSIVDQMTAGDNVAKGEFSATKQKYKNLIALEPLTTKAKGGNISPSLLNNRISKVYGRSYARGNAGDIGDLARIGYEILPELGGSDTLQKGAYLATAAGGLANPASIAPITVGLAANRAFQSGINRNPTIINQALKRAKTKR